MRRRRTVDSKLITFLWELSGIVPARIVSKFGSLERNLDKASIRTAFRVYVGLMAFASITSGLAAFAMSLPMLTLLHFAIIQSLALSTLVGILVGGLSIVICFFYPVFVASSRANKIDANLPTIANFMSVLASSGMPLENIFRSLARVGDDFSVGKEVGGIVRDIELMGMDLRAALRKASENSPSRAFAAMLDGVVTTAHMGGDLAQYLRDESDKFKRGRTLKMRHFIDSLGIIAETYIAFMVAAPLMLIVMLSVMSFIGGDITIGNLDIDVLLNLLTFVFLPGGVSIMILLVDSMSPPR
jgi:flagellar protein FlaJ